MPVRALAGSLLIAMAGGCSGADSLTRVPSGRWGGEHVELTVGSASAQVEFDCAHGSIPGPIPLRDGAFDVAGVYVLEHGGPVREGEVLPQFSARYRGTADEERMTLTIDAEGLGNVGSYALDLGRSGRIIKCL